ncbi:glycosyltransferase family 4 protein [Mycolicibacterium elephantis]|uniref:glycosyltransferase family 4 protein n=1 Tax=Mycolicibacterium elephantis TaxID=81858 RepID=UPI000FE230D5|nr:glycosyltransferase family 1 protein [Mycolicibacterium elephantis]MCV7220896.1 glycosyltransferase family 4 protein [Mycolicibacterium elephantis]
MKVAFDHRIFSMQRYGGVSRYIFELASRLPSDAVSEVRIVAPVYINNYLMADSARRFGQGRYVHADFAGIRHMVGVANRIAQPIAWSSTNADIVHETYYSMVPVGKGRRRVITVHDMIHELFLPNAKRVIASKRAAVNRADHIICISETTRRDLINLYGIDAAQTSVVHLGYSLTSEIKDAEERGSRQRPSLLYVGHRGGYKNFSTVLQAFSSSPTLRQFDLVAFGGHPLQLDERKEIERLGIADRVRYECGSDRKLAECYRTAAAFVYPSKYEGFGIPPLEAMSHGCPVVCSRGGSIPEIVGDAGAYFDPCDAEELRSTLELVVTTESLQADLRVRGFARISAFSWDRCAAETAQVYRDIL